MTTVIDNEIVKATATKLMFMVNYGKKLSKLTQEEYDNEITELGNKWYISSDNYSNVEDAIKSAYKYAEQCLEVFHDDNTLAETFDNKVNYAKFTHVVESSDGDRDKILDALKSLK